jgi:hypothetical protein
MAQAAKTNFAAAARGAGVEVKTTDLVARGAAYPEVGVNTKVDDAAFALKTNETSAPIQTDNAVVVVHVRERQEIIPTAFANERDTLRQQLTAQRANEFFSAYMAKAKQKMKIEYNPAAVATIAGNFNP